MAKIQSVVNRSEEAQTYRTLYSSKHWKTLRRQALTRDAYQCQHSGCGAHLQAGRDHPRSAVVHHLKPHKGDLELFFDLDNLQSVCWTCHSGDIQSMEARGYDSTIGVDGWPTDPKHPSVA
jgi:5-methylcytosine-specific restriction protein A